MAHHHHVQMVIEEQNVRCSTYDAVQIRLLVDKRHVKPLYRALERLEQVLYHRRKHFAVSLISQRIVMELDAARVEWTIVILMRR